MIYFDNSATTYPKPYSAFTANVNALRYNSFNSGRGGYAQSLLAAEKIYSVREKIGNMFGFPAENIAFTKNCTEALNIAIRSSVKRGEHIIISSLEHNSVSRVVKALVDELNITYDIAPFSFDDDETVNNFNRLIKPQTRLIVCMHTSNVFGVMFPIRRIGELCRQKNIRFVVDAAQGAGVADINAARDNIDILCAAGHKSLFGPMGTGFIAFDKSLSIAPLMQGGTGSSSLDLSMPSFYPDRLEAGTLNNSGIISLGEGIDFINRTGIDKIYSHEMLLSSMLYDGISRIDNAKLYTPKPIKGKAMPIISFNIADYSSEKTAAFLAKYDVCVRAGYHCSPLAHRHFGTLDGGTVRLSPGYFNTEKECYRFIKLLKNLR